MWVHGFNEALYPPEVAAYQSLEDPTRGSHDVGLGLSPQLLHMLHDACSRVPGSNGRVVGPGFSVAASSDDQGWSVLGSWVVRLCNGPSSE